MNKNQIVYFTTLIGLDNGRYPNQSSVLHSIRMREGYVQEPLSGLGHRGIALSQDMGANVQERKEPC